MAFDPYHEWLGIPAEEQPPNHYRLLGITQFENSPKVIETAADRQMGHLRNYQSGKHSALSQKLLNEVSTARVCLLNAEKKAAYDQQLRAQLQARPSVVAGLPSSVVAGLPTEPQGRPSVVAGLPTEPQGRPQVSGRGGDLRSGERQGQEPRAEQGATRAAKDAGLEQLFEKTSHAQPVGHAVTARNKQTQIWTAAGIVAIGLVAVIFILIRVSGSSNDTPARPGPSPVAQNDPPKPPEPPTLTKKPPEPEKSQPVTPVRTTPDETPAPVQGNGPAPPPAVAPFDAAQAREYQEAWGKYLGVPVEGTNSIGMKFVLIPPGEFELGTAKEEIDRLTTEAKAKDPGSWYWWHFSLEGPRHRVRLTRPFYFGACEVTVGQFSLFVKESGYRTDAEKKGNSTTWWNAFRDQSKGCPATCLSWNDAVAFCGWLGGKETTIYRLPTEAEWEYSCRAGTTTSHCCGDDEGLLPEYAWFRPNSGLRTHPGGTRRPNSWGLFDMHGNAWEWCADWYGQGYYGKSAVDDPVGPPSGTERIVRSGTCSTGPWLTRSAFRTSIAPIGTDQACGFRVVRESVTAGLQPVQPAETATAQNPATPEPPDVETPSRLPVPAEEDRAKVAGQLKELFELDKDRTPDQRKKLAADMAGLAAKSEKPAERYVLLVTAAQLYCQAGDGAGALRAVDKLAEAFDVDALSLKASLIKQLAGEAKDSEAIGAMLDAGDSVIDAALAGGKYDVALELVEEAYKACAQSTGREHRKRAYDRRKEVQALAASWQEVQSALEKLKITPDDPEANLAAGRYYCFDQGDWTKGLPCLAKSSDADLKKLAEEESTNPPSDADAMLKLADAWWDLSESRRDAEHDALLLRAGTWYREVQPEITSTLVKAKVDKRLEEIQKLGRPIPEPALLGPPPPAVAPFNEARAKRYQQRWAKYLGVPVETTNSIGMKLVLIPPGEFLMGTSSEDIERLLNEATGQSRPEWYAARVRGQGPQHPVGITKPFRLGACEVTVAQFRKFVEATHYQTDAEKSGEGVRGQFPTTDDHPVGDVSWNDAIAFCKWLSSKDGRSYRLPTEAEWEYACRSGTTTRFFFGNDEGRLADYAWWTDNSRKTPHPVGQKLASPWGLYDTHGNLWEWCLDWCALDYFSQSPRDDPQGPTSGVDRVLRGGSFGSRPWELPSAYRTHEKPHRPTYGYGFRVVCEAGDRPSRGPSPPVATPE